jgi:hypothetical protein
VEGGVGHRMTKRGCFNLPDPTLNGDQRSAKRARMRDGREWDGG